MRFARNAENLCSEKKEMYFIVLIQKAADLPSLFQERKRARKNEVQCYRRGAGRRCWSRGYGGGQGNGAGMGGYFSLLRMYRIYDGGMVPAADIGK